MTHSIANTYKRFDLTIAYGKGSTLYDETDQPYLDFTAGIGVNSLGYAHPAWLAAVTAQLNAVQHTSNLYYNSPSLTLAKTLCERTHFEKVIFMNSGAEANETAIKVARKYGHDHGDKHHHEIITLVNSFHGRTITTLSATGQDKFHKHFAPFDPSFIHVPINDIRALNDAITNHTVAIFIETILGEGGVVSLDDDYIKDVAQLCEENGLLLMVDEVQTGLGRTGALFSYEHYGLKPDIVTCAKGLGAGLPIGAVLLSEKVKDVLQPGDHGSTFGGNPVVCAGANVVMDTLTKSFLQEVKEKGAYFVSQLKLLSGIESVSGQGLMLGATFKGKDAQTIVNQCFSAKMLVLSANDKVRFLPPLIISYDEIDQGIACLKHILESEE